MAANEQVGNSPARKLGRGISALLGAPVRIHVPREAPVPLSPAPATPSVVAGDPPALGRTSLPGIPSESPSPNLRPVESPVEVTSRQVGLREIPVEQIVPNRRQPRADFDEASLSSLAASIRQAGLMQPIMVRPTVRGFELVAGERRWRAAKMLGLTMMLAMILNLLVGALVAMAVPLTLQRFGRDPALGSSVLLTFSTDSMGFLIFLGLATVFFR